MQRQKAKEILERLGATVTNSVSGRTDVLIVGDEPGQSKAQAAAEKGIPTIGWETLIALGFLDRREHGHALPWPEDLTSKLSMQMALITEELYVTPRDRNGRAYRSAIAASQAIECLLRSAYGEPTGGSHLNDESSSVSDDGSV